MDNAPYHSVQVEKLPTKSWRKDEYAAWLMKHDIKFNPSAMKMELMSKALAHKPEKRYKIDEMVREYGHQVLRLPPCHCQYNPIELVWANCKGYYKKHTRSNNKFMMQLSEPFGKKPLLESHLKGTKAIFYNYRKYNNKNHKEVIVSSLSFIVDRLSLERAEVKEVVRKELSSQLAALEQEVARTREELAESRVRAQLQLAAKEEKLKALAATKETELQEVYRRVKLAVAKKDESVQQLQKQYEAALERCCHLEDLLEQQRRDFLLK
uniref:Uncharacterized protein n=1 Tax=Timema cristinae TaxID=61476 RepID=A0A7R9CJA7_TIMCR|nr:unnamed protein product [Timema cristinae]